MKYRKIYNQQNGTDTTSIIKSSQNDIVPISSFNRPIDHVPHGGSLWSICYIRSMTIGIEHERSSRLYSTLILITGSKQFF